MNSQEPKPPRRRLTPAERIAAREAEIEAIRASRHRRVSADIAKAVKLLQDARLEARACGMDEEAGSCDRALEHLPR